MNEREIKFRVWDGERMHAPVRVKALWQPGEYGYSESRALVYAEPKGRNADVAEEHEDLVLMQYTGLTDVKGQEIYEGDVVRERCSDFVGEVVYSTRPEDLGWRVKGPSLEKTYPNGNRKPQITIQILNGSHVVIGNRFENPELLEDA